MITKKTKNNNNIKQKDPLHGGSKSSHTTTLLEHITTTIGLTDITWTSFKTFLLRRWRLIREGWEVKLKGWSLKVGGVGQSEILSLVLTCLIQSDNNKRRERKLIETSSKVTL